jgi:hypothetical protein
MSVVQKTAAAVLMVLLVAAGYGLWATNQSATPVRALKTSPAAAASAAMPIIDENTLLTARRLARLAATPDEQSLAQAAVQAADHELDLAFAAALRHLEAHPPPLSPEASQIQDRLLEAQKTLASYTESVKQLTAELTRAADADKAAVQDRLDLAQSQVELAQDEVQEANQDLLQAGGNVHQRIQMMQQEHQAAVRDVAQAPAPAAASPLGSLHGLVGQIREWLALHSKRRWLSEAQQQATASAAQLAVERQLIAAELAASKARVPELSAHAPRAAVAAATALLDGTGKAAPGPARSSAASAQVKAAAAAGPVAAANRSAPAAVDPGASDAPATLLDLTRRIVAEQHRLTLRDQQSAPAASWPTSTASGTQWSPPRRARCCMRC